MPFIVKDEKKDFVPCPAGPQQAVCCDVVDLGMKETDYGTKHKLEIRWQTAEVDEEGKPFIIRNWYTVSFHEKASLRNDLEAWLGRKLTTCELKEGFDLDFLLGKNCYLNIIHKDSEKGVFANVGAVMPLPKGMTPIEVGEYVREQDRIA